MKKELNKLFIFVGFVVFSIGVVLGGTDYIPTLPILLGTVNLVSVYLLAVLSVPFIFSENKLFNNIGYAFTVLMAGYAVYGLIMGAEIGVIISSVGMLIMFIGTIMRFFVICLNYFGFIKTSNDDKTLNKSSDALKILAYYKELQGENILTAEEFEEIKQKMLNDVKPKANSMEDIKKWKKLFDQKVISEEEFTAIKAEMLGK
ncbi:MAG: SHOCT domain-containing protein [Clostridia bacterium]|nr:SHOCT domain-containing protein [Clostridia bacterium]